MTAPRSIASSPRLLVAGKGGIACEVLDYALSAFKLWGERWSLVGLPTQGDSGQDSWEPSFLSRCELHGVPTVRTLTNAGLRPGDLLLSLQFDKIIRIADLGGASAYNVHFSALPKHRGCFPGIWAIREGDAYAGVSLHVLTAGIDDGPIVDQTRISLHEDTTARGLYDQMHACGAALIQRHLGDLLQGRISTTPQEEAQSTYHDRHSIDFNALELPFEALDASACARLARSLIFPPFQYPTLSGRQVVACKVIPDLPGVAAPNLTPSIQELPNNQMIVRCKSGWLYLWAGALTRKQ